jgi:hypothetical protein
MVQLAHDIELAVFGLGTLRGGGARLSFLRSRGFRCSHRNLFRKYLFLASTALFGL